MTSPPTTFCVFSFNRGQFLRNCVESIEQCVPAADIWVFDDDSDDPETCRYLRSIKEQHRVITPRKKGDIKHGGLYHNMQYALMLARDHSLMVFLQDDTQVVRPVAQGEIHWLNHLFEQNPSLGFIHPCFVRGIDLSRRPLTAEPGPAEHTFFRGDTGQSAGIHYSDLLIARPERLLAQGWEFHQSEPANDREAKALFGAMAYLRSPFAMWLPEVPAWRGKKKTWGLKLAERKKRCGFYPFERWGQEASDTFRARTTAHLPIAEDFLRCHPEPPSKPWTYNPLTGLRWHKHLNNLEVFLRRMLSHLR